MNNLGDVVEELVEGLIKQSGWLQLPTRKFSDDHGHEVAPMLEGDNRKRIMPDFYVSHNGESAWIESKGKEGALWVTKNARYEHGIDKPNWRHYHKVKDATGIDVWIFVYEEDTGLLLRQEIDELDVVGTYEKDEYGPDSKYDGPMVFFDKLDFDVVKLRREHVPSVFFGQDRFDIETHSDWRDDFELLPSDDDEDADENQSGLDEYLPATDGGEPDDDDDEEEENE